MSESKKAESWIVAVDFTVALCVHLLTMPKMMPESKETESWIMALHNCIIMVFTALRFVAYSSSKFQQLTFDDFTTISPITRTTVLMHGTVYISNVPR